MIYGCEQDGSHSPTSTERLNAGSREAGDNHRLSCNDVIERLWPVYCLGMSVWANLDRGQYGNQHGALLPTH
jgi:hypothetical protein